MDSIKVFNYMGIIQMLTIKRLIIGMLFIISFTLKTLYPYAFVKNAPLIKRDKFKLGTGYYEYHKKDVGSVFKIPFIMQLGLSKRVEFLGIFPYLQMKYVRNQPETFGDILLYLKFDIKTFAFNYSESLTQQTAINQIDMIIGFNLATGPSIEAQDGEIYAPYSLGLPDFRLGILYNQSVGNFSYDLDFIYTFAAHAGEEYLHFSDSLWSDSKKRYLFGIINTLVKFLWPGRYPWADKEAPEWEQYPHHDDFFHWHNGFKYYFDPDWLLFSYEIFAEISWINSWSKHSTFPSYLLLTPGLVINITEFIDVTGGISLLLDHHVYKYDEDFYFNNLYFLGIKFLL